MALEDLAKYRAEPNYTVLYPSDAVSAERLLTLMAYHPGPAYMRTSRPKTPVIYGNDDTFTIGGLKVLRASGKDVATVIGAGITVFEALKAYDQLIAAGIAIRVIDLYSVQPVDKAALVAAGKATGGHLITVEDHYAAGGIGDVFARLDPSGRQLDHVALAKREMCTEPELADQHDFIALQIDRQDNDDTPDTNGVALERRAVQPHAIALITIKTAAAIVRSGELDLGGGIRQIGIVHRAALVVQLTPQPRPRATLRD